MISKLIFISTLCVITQAAYLNDYDGILNYVCPSSKQTISRVQSIHDNGPEDRRFDLSCSDVLPGNDGLQTPICYWTDYQNDYDKLLHFSCPTSNYISGMNSMHDNGAEDRKWKFYCCRIPDVHMSDCSFSGWTNEFDKVQDFTVPQNQVLKGVISRHDNGPEDRRYEYEYCGVYRTEGSSVIG